MDEKPVVVVGGETTNNKALVFKNLVVSKAMGLLRAQPVLVIAAVAGTLLVASVTAALLVHNGRKNSGEKTASGSSVGQPVSSSTNQTTSENGKQPSTSGQAANKSETKPSTSAATKPKSPTAKSSSTPASMGSGSSTGASSGGSSSGGTTAPPPSPTPTPSPTVSCPNATHTPGGSDGMGGCWPYAANTGVPSGTVLSAYTGPCSVHSSIVIENKTVNCALQIYSNASVTIRKSVVNGFIENTASNGTGKVIIEDSEVNAGAWSDGAVWGSYYTVARTEVTGGQHNVHCETSCTITDSWLHDQYNPNGGSYHNNAFLSNGGANYTLRHNTLHCTAILNATDGGCTGDLTLLGDFDVISQANIDSNLFMANNSSISFCTYGGYSPGKPYPNAHHVVYTNNIFQRGANNKCGVYGPVTSFQTTAVGNQWTNNRWSDGSILDP